MRGVSKEAEKRCETQKKEIVEYLKIEPRTLKETAEHFKLTYVNAQRYISNLKGSNKYVFVMGKKLETSNKNKKNKTTFFIEREAEKKTKTLFECIPLEKLPKEIHKLQLIDWYILNPIYQVKNTRELIKIAKSKDKLIYELNWNGEKIYC